jgi:ferredoxin
VNEDVVIPLPRMGDYCDGIERINIELSIANKITLCDALTEFLKGELPLHAGDANLIGDRGRLLAGRPRWQGCWKLDLAEPKHHSRRLAGLLDNLDQHFHRLQDYRLRVSWKTELKAPLEVIFDGNVFRPVTASDRGIHKEILRGRVFVALHMHAGDGNVHTNIPVNSDNYAMLQTAYQAVERIMALAKSLGGVISGEHGIGITKLEFLSEARSALPRLQAAHRPGRPLQPRQADGRRRPGQRLHAVSFSLLGVESLIMEQSDIGKISDSIKDCLRCGKCKPVCSTHVPRANLLYSPRNKILGTSLLIEAFLYEEQTRRGISLQHFDEFDDVADHCTVCHKCVKPCPVDIDFGDVSVAMRNFLRRQGKKKFNPGTAAAMAFLTAKDPATIKLMRAGMIQLGYKAQRLGHTLAKPSA